MRNVISALVQNVPGVLSHVAGMLAARGYNVDSLTVGETDDPKFSRMTIVLNVDPDRVSQVQSQLQKLVSVVETANLSCVPHVERDLALIRVKATPEKRGEIVDLAQIFRASVVDVSTNSMLIEICGSETKIGALIDVLRPYGLMSAARTGCVAAPRGDVADPKFD